MTFVTEHVHFISYIRCRESHTHLLSSVGCLHSRRPPAGRRNRTSASRPGASPECRRRESLRVWSRLGVSAAWKREDHPALRRRSAYPYPGMLSACFSRVNGKRECYICISAYGVRMTNVQTCRYDVPCPRPRLLSSGIVLER